MEGCENYGPKHASNVVQAMQNLITESALRGSTGAQVWRAATLLGDIRRYRQYFSVRQAALCGHGCCVGLLCQ